MVEAFVLGFWIIWSGGRDIHPLSEGFWFTVIAAVLRQLIDFSLPQPDTHWFALNGALWAYVALAFVAVNRFSTTFMTTMLMAAAAGIGYFQLLHYLPERISGWLA